MDQTANVHWIIEKAREFQKNIYFCFINYAFDCVDYSKLWKILKEMGIPDHLTCLLRNLYVGQEATVRTGRGTMDWFQIGKGVRQGCILLPCLFNLYAGYFTWKVRLDEAQAGIKMAGKNINNLRYADDTSLWKVVVEWKKTPGFLAPRGEEFNPGPETRLDCLELLCNKVLLKYKGDRESFWHRHQKGAEEYPPASL